ncbi:hypothetical protein OGAPHI_000543 [Ogataea philodendri]|uniref:Uncharacterized protein n=3 Tax=Saccharomycotina TaxID=147537 RepID=A0A9P8PGV9_9ASCO|nr:uncharacterized protein OGAPHI_000543 [Ogataea philodendri]KAH3671320.1 hypothetical protein OGAPHI_000543 [Ogataea philodendri]
MSSDLAVDQVRVQSVISHSKVHLDHPVDHDEAVILALGYKQELKRDFSMFTTFAIAFSTLGLLPSVAGTLWYSMAYTGNAGITWVYLVAMGGILCVALSMAEIASAFPTSGGLYYATAMLAPPKYKAFLSWFVGWSNYLTQITGGPSVGYSTASMILALKEISDPNYEYQKWHCFLLATSITISSACIASLPVKWISIITSGTSTLNMVFLFITWVVFLGGNNRVEQGLPKFNSNSDAWKIVNMTEWPDGFAVLMSFMAAIWIMSGFDAPFHLAEESANAEVVTPNAIVLTAVLGGILGFAFQVGMSYTIVDVTAAMESEVGQPFVAFLFQVLDKKRVYALASFAIILSYIMDFSSMLAASRVLYSYSRDGCIPLSRFWCRVNPYTKTPVNAVWFNWFIGECLLCLLFGGVAINAVFSFGATGAFISFTVPTFLRITYARNTFKPGPWNLGKLSYVTGTIGCAFVLMMIPILNFPQFRGKDNTLDLMNWTCVVYWGAMFLVVVYWFAYGRTFFTGPKSNVEVIYADEEGSRDEKTEIDEVVKQ